MRIDLVKALPRFQIQQHIYQLMSKKRGRRDDQTIKPLETQKKKRLQNSFEYLWQPPTCSLLTSKQQTCKGNSGSAQYVTLAIKIG
jgi:hypothetical protein